jgi:hypothetical protein
MSDEHRRRSDEALRYFFAKRDRREQAAFPIPKKPTGNRSTVVLLDNAPVAAFAGAFLGCVTTLGLSALGIVPCVASALATALLCGQLLVTRTAAGLFADAFFPALYGGSFGGMTPIVWLGDGAPGHWAMLTGLLFISLSAVCGLAFFAVAKLDIRSAAPFGSGYGGRLGAIATMASLLFIELVGPFGDIGRFNEIRASASGVESWPAPLGFFACLGGILGTMFTLRQRRAAAAGVATRIFIASVVALTGLLGLHLGNPDDTPTSEAFYAGCFLGMSTPERLKGWLQPLFGAIVLTAMLVLERCLLSGVGGGLGLAALSA